MVGRWRGARAAKLLSGSWRGRRCPRPDERDLRIGGGGGNGGPDEAAGVQGATEGPQAPGWAAGWTEGSRAVAAELSRLTAPASAAGAEGTAATGAGGGRLGVAERRVRPRAGDADRRRRWPTTVSAELARLPVSAASTGPRTGMRVADSVTTAPS